MSIVIAAALAALCGLAILFIFIGLRPANSPDGDLLEARLSQFNRVGRSVQSLTEVELTLPFFERVFRPTFDKWSQRLAARTGQARTSALADKINLAGKPLGLTVGGFLVLRLISLLVFIGLGILFAGFESGGDFAIIVLSVGLAVALGALLPDAMLSQSVRKRQKAILIALPSALDLLTISVEAGLGFDASLARVCEKYHNPLTAEFNQVLSEIRLGRPRIEALDDLGRRNKVDELNNFVQAIIQSDQLGVGIANVLRIQSEEIRRRRRQRAEELGQKAPLKMLFPMVGCIFPTLFIVLLGPAALSVGHLFFGGH